MARQIFVTSCALYNSGRFVLECGDWIDVSSDVDEMKEEIEELKKSIKDFGEEWFISDTNDFECDEHESLQTIAQKEELFETYNNDPLVQAILEQECTLENAKGVLDCYTGYSFDDEDKLAEWYFKQTMDFCDLNETQQRALWRFYTREKALIEIDCDYNVTNADGTYYVFYQG